MGGSWSTILAKNLGSVRLVLDWVLEMTCKLLTACSLPLLIFAAGCGGSDKAEVKGKVTVDGEAVTVGTISFTTEDGANTAAAEVQSDGSYSFQNGVVPGTHVVEYSPPFVEGPDDENWDKVKDFLECTVPDDFRAKVEPGENTIDIKLVKKQ